MEKKFKENIREAAEVANTNEIIGKNLKSKLELRIEQGIVCTINQFLTFGLDLTVAEKTKIVKAQLPEKDKETGDFAPWFTRALWPIRNSLATNEKVPIYEKLHELKRFKFDDSKKNEKSDVLGSIDGLNKFLYMKIPEPFNHVKKEKVTVKNKFVTINGVKVKVTPDLVFVTKMGGKTHIGAVKILLRKGKPLGSDQLKIGSHILHQFLIDNQNEFEGKVNRELCVFIDVFHDQIVVAPDKTSVPQVELRNICTEYSDLWVKLVNQEINQTLKPNQEN